MQSRQILESLDVQSGFIPVDMSTAANNGTYISLKEAGRFGVLLFKNTGASGEPPTITIQQASDVSGTGAKALNFTTIYTKLGASSVPGTWTKVTQAAANTYALAAGNTEGFVWIEIETAALDVENGFDCVRATIADVGATAQIGGLLYVLGHLHTETAPENKDDPTAN